MIVAIHQPNYLPWMGYFHKMMRADVLVFLDDVQYTKGGYINRVRILSAKGARWLTVPVRVHLGQSILEVEPDRPDWKDSHLGLLRNEYRSAAKAGSILPELAEILEAAPQDSIAESNIAVLEAMAFKLDLKTKFLRSSDLATKGSGDDRLVEIVRTVSAGGTYLSGGGGAKYQDKDKFRLAGLGFDYVDFRHPVYEQGSGDFVPGLSIIDCVLRHGWEETRSLIEGSPA